MVALSLPVVVLLDVTVGVDQVAASSAYAVHGVLLSGASAIVFLCRDERLLSAQSHLMGKVTGKADNKLSNYVCDPVCIVHSEACVCVRAGQSLKYPVLFLFLLFCITL